MNTLLYNMLILILEMKVEFAKRLKGGSVVVRVSPGWTGLIPSCHFAERLSSSQMKSGDHMTCRVHLLFMP